MPALVKCQQCGKSFSVIPARAQTAKFCSIRCRSDWRAIYFVGAGNPKWQGGIRVKECQHCGTEYTLHEKQPYSSFLKSKFCSKQCADVGGFRYSGDAHPNWTGGTKKRNHQHATWAQTVISRDSARCVKCDAQGVELHAHHVKPWKQFPELRFDLDNGITVCAYCHWAIHSASNENAVNSGKLLTGGAEDNPEPSPSGNIREGVTTRGRAYRRWEGYCDWCGCFLSKRLSDATNRSANFCSRSCAGKYRVRHNGAFQRPRQ